MDLLVRLACNVLTNIVTHKNNRTMKILQAITLSALLLLNISKVCSQEDKKTKDFFNSGGYISEGYALDRNKYDLISPAILCFIIFLTVI